ncbi:MAG: phosphate ABC transporter permease PstA [Gammaproteobacteria bacterium]|nr:phosphate ABC transporter permease PstA [Gammaproteobacteria bacterium]
MRQWFNTGTPWIWLNAAAVATSLILVFGLLGLIAVRGLGFFWPSDVMQAEYTNQQGDVIRIIGEIHDEEEISATRVRDSGFSVPDDDSVYTRYLFKVGNRDQYGIDFRQVLAKDLDAITYPETVMVIERREWGNFYGFLRSVSESGQVVAEGEAARAELNTRLERALDLHEQIRDIEKGDIGQINYELERLRLRERALELEGSTNPARLADIAEERDYWNDKYQALQSQLSELYSKIDRDSLSAEIQDGRMVEIPLAKVVHVTYPNDMNLLQKIGTYFMKLWEFVSDEPREANTEGGIFPAIFGTVMMVIIMSIIVTPFGVIAAVYLHEYAKQGTLVRIIRIAVNNLAGVPSIVYGVFGLGFFVYFLGGNIDSLFFPEAKPSPTFGTPGLLWSSLTLALLTLPVVIVATEEGLSRVPRSLREGSLALGATKLETIWRIILPTTSPAMMTGLILAVARAAGEVAPLMLVGVVKLAPSLPLDGNAPFLHLERKFMHLGFHIYDVGFQSPNVEAARPLVYATSLLLVLVIIGLNLVAIQIRNRLREKYRALES